MAFWRTWRHKAVGSTIVKSKGKFTAADVLLASHLAWEIMQKQIEPLPVFVRYLDRCRDREAARRADALDNALAQPA